MEGTICPSPTGLSPSNNKHHGRVVYIQTGNIENSTKCSPIQSASSVTVHSLQSFSYLISDQDKNRRKSLQYWGLPVWVSCQFQQAFHWSWPILILCCRTVQHTAAASTAP